MMSSASENKNKNKNKNDINKESRKFSNNKNRSLWSKITFGWLYPVIRRGYQTPLEQQDLVDIEGNDSSKALADLVNRYWEEELEISRLKKRKASFVRAIIKSFGFTYFWLGITAFLEECVFKILAPILLGLLIRYFNKEPGYTDAVGFTIVICLIISNFGALICHHPLFYGTQSIGMKVRIASSALIYRKALKLSTRAMQKTTVGQMVNLLSNDVNRFDISSCFLNYLWIGPVQCIITTVLLWHQLGPSCIAGMIFILLYVPFQSYMGKKFSKLRLKIAERTDERVRLMNEIVTSMRVIKMYAWEKPFRKVIEQARKWEIDTILKSNYLRAINLSLFITAAKVVVFVALLVFVLTGNVLTAEKVFVTVSLMNNIRLTMTLFFYFAVSLGSEARISCMRIQSFLEMEEKEDCSAIITSNLRPKPRHCNIVAKNVFARWDNRISEDNLKNISFTAKAGELVTLIGSVGSGKSSLMHAILGELPIHEGSIKIQGKISYATQEPWIFSGTVRDNILFGQPYYAKKYSEVIKVCSLERDIELFSDGDQTVVGERGMSLSGGQKARISLARAMYVDADIYLLDDPLSAVDAHVGKHLFEKCISSYLSSKVVILATHQLQFIETASQVLVLRNGYIEAQGTYSQIKNQGVDFSLLMDESEEVEEEESVIPVITDNHLLTTITRLRRASENWSLRHGSVGEISELGIDNRSLLAGQGMEGSFLSLHHDDLYSLCEENYETKIEANKETKQTGSIGVGVYIHYFILGGGWFMLFLLAAVSIICQVTFVGTEYWLSYWTNEEKLRGENQVVLALNGEDIENTVESPGNRMYYVYIYTIIVVVLLASALLRSFIYFTMCMTSSRNLHNDMFAAIIRASMHFFETHPIGQILNRFTKDTGQVDDLLPPAMFDFLVISMTIISIVLMIFYINIWIALPTGVLAFFFIGIRNIYIPSARDIKRLEGIARSPVFSHLSSTFEGLSTIRAFQTQDTATAQFDTQQDIHTSSWIMYLASTRLFGIYLDLLSTIFIAIVTLSFMFQKDTIGGDVGLAISLAMTLSGTLQWGVRQSAEVESHMTSVERILEYSKLEPEPSNDSEKEKAKDKWPNNGKINFQNVFLSYKGSETPVLHDLNFTINPGEKIGIVGRTGAGKSSLISCIFRLTVPEGNIYIDDIPTDSISLEILRKSISIIPQDPTLFSGTLRYNMDPFSEYSDEAIWSALEQVELKAFVVGLGNGLLSEITEGGSNLSVGQRQLVCLARAILKHNKILVMDEATANVDPKTDSWIQETIRRKFVDCTVLTIAHRLHTIMDCDRIMVMDAGRLREFDQPYVLLEDSSTILSSLVEQTGSTSAAQLKQMAKEAYYKKDDQIYHSTPEDTSFDVVKIMITEENDPSDHSYVNQSFIQAEEVCQESECTRL